MKPHPFVEGESCLLYDDKGKQYLLALDSAKQFHSDRGMIPHTAIVGQDEGSKVTSSKGVDAVVMRPRLADYVLKMKRGAAVMYPKDAGALITWADISPGDTVLEAGTGSGALTLGLSRAVGTSGSVITVERRDDHQAHARKLIAGFRGSTPGNIEFRIGDVEEFVAEIEPDRIVLDLPEPWLVAPIAGEHLTGGGVLASYLPTVPQVQQLRESMDRSNAFIEMDTFEILMRSWAVTGRSVRPEHRMVGHTGFITIGRRRL
ncbi:MAG: tRNA (adenine-N1)-methyltransferase [Actinomycetota bacterium]|nr:tRNA (adenine-N1)-methyltransferase [Actinomycetota bacterium]